MIRILMLSRPVEVPPSRARWKSRFKAAGLSCEAFLEIPESNGPPALTPRQIDVLRGMALGLKTREIARKLRVGVKTAETHRQQLMARLKIRTIPGLVRYALRSGVIPATWLLE